ncbi:MAG: STAS domain-containing protein [Desulfobacterales bacterium]|nr:STAS domain-containing protein [Desulfobacterales bacterium]
MENHIEIQDDIVIINLSGNLVRSTGEDLKNEVSGLIDKGFRYLLVDLSNVHLIDSYGITVCIAFYKMVENIGGRLLFVNPRPAVEKVFHITRADQKLQVVNSRQEGITAIHEKIRTTVEIK